MRRCPNLQTVSIELRVYAVLNFGVKTFAKPIEEVSDNYRLDDMLDLEKLKVLRLGAPVKDSNQFGAWEDLGDRFKDEYAARGRALTVRIFDRVLPVYDDDDDYY